MCGNEDTLVMPSEVKKGILDLVSDSRVMKSVVESLSRLVKNVVANSYGKKHGWVYLHRGGSRDQGSFVIEFCPVFSLQKKMRCIQAPIAKGNFFSNKISFIKRKGINVNKMIVPLQQLFIDMEFITEESLE